ncbi:uncharacterized protein [Hetaerina americana]|uniref:uncharacterized protein n=1 Tax=Hetaerina americana TaxID=62018 RepID=UPI003A7F158D
MRIKMPAVRIAQAEAEVSSQDILTCGVCQKPFALSDIVKFIQHKVLACNKENYDSHANHLHNNHHRRRRDDDEEGDSDDGSAPQALLVNSRRPSISAPINAKKSVSGNSAASSSSPSAAEERLGVGSEAGEGMGADGGDGPARSPSTPPPASLTPGGSAPPAPPPGTPSSSNHLHHSSSSSTSSPQSPQLSPRLLAEVAAAAAAAAANGSGTPGSSSGKREASDSADDARMTPRIKQERLESRVDVVDAESNTTNSGGYVAVEYSQGVERAGVRERGDAGGLRAEKGGWGRVEEEEAKDLKVESDGEGV